METQCTTTHGELVWHNLWALVIIIIVYYIIILYYYVFCILKYFSHYIVTKCMTRSNVRQERFVLAHRGDTVHHDGTHS